MICLKAQPLCDLHRQSDRNSGSSRTERHGIALFLP